MSQIRTIANPIVPGDYPDPSVVRVGDDYYMVTSTFQYFPGVPVMHSRDLVHWRTIGHVITRRGQLCLTGIPDSYGVFAPDISYYDGKFWVVVPYYHGQPRCTNIVYSAERPEGPYSDGVVLNHHFIDPSIFNDDDGRRYLAFGGGWLHELSADGTQLIGEARQVWPGLGGAAPEAPHVVKKDGWYYYMLAEGGTFFEHRATVARSASVWGPYEPNPDNPVLMQRDPAHALQRAGHGKLVQDTEGGWWMLHLGGRPLTPGGDCPLGRETMLARVEWTADGWFTVGSGGSPQETVQLEASRLHEAADEDVDRFEGSALSPVWEWVRHPLQGGYALQGDGLRIHCLPYILTSPQDTLILTRRWRDFAFKAETELLFDTAALGEEAGLVLYRDTDAHLLVTVRNGIGQTSGQSFDVARLHERQEYGGLHLQIDRCENGHRSAVAKRPLPIHAGEAIRLTAMLAGGRVSIAYAAGRGAEQVIAAEQVDVSFLYPERVPRFHCFTAPRVGVFARGVYGTKHGSALFTLFHYEGKDEQERSTGGLR